MLPVSPAANQYAGINAHLHSYWYATHTWNSFHAAYIAALAQTLKVHLRPLGYTAALEHSLQIKSVTSDMRFEPRADILVSDTGKIPPAPSSMTRPLPIQSMATLHTNVAEMLDLPDDDHIYSAIMIHPLSKTLSQHEPVTWIELLSPSNKGRTESAYKYREKRQQLLEGGMVFVEVDFLHTTPATIPRLNNYVEHDPYAYAYRIVVLDPRPTLELGPADAYEFGVDMPIPLVKIPLRVGESLLFDFGAAYNQHFIAWFYGDEGVDYTQFPLEFRRYSSDDQARIANRMLTVLRAAAAGVDLDASAPLPIEHPLPLTDALDAIAALTQTTPT
ncbi:MAG: DUF4058 family protein [Chloroflexota bacterium]|nr:DUF4058 family protein [Chloroflexota bacterium]